jgi:hypothetical protein
MPTTASRRSALSPSQVPTGALPARVVGRFERVRRGPHGSAAASSDRADRMPRVVVRPGCAHPGGPKKAPAPWSPATKRARPFAPETVAARAAGPCRTFAHLLRAVVPSIRLTPGRCLEQYRCPERLCNHRSAPVTVRVSSRCCMSLSCTISSSMFQRSLCTPAEAGSDSSSLRGRGTRSAQSFFSSAAGAPTLMVFAVRRRVAPCASGSFDV